MKKLAVIIVFIMLIPCPAFGMQMLSNSSLDNITGQSGVSIAVNNLQIYLHIDTIMYIDKDGVSQQVAPSAARFGSEGGAIGIKDFTLNLLNVNQIVGGSQDPQTGAWQFQTVPR